MATPTESPTTQWHQAGTQTLTDDAIIIMAAWRSGNVVGRIIGVTLRRARLVRYKIIMMWHDFWLFVEFSPCDLESAWTS